MRQEWHKKQRQVIPPNKWYETLDKGIESIQSEVHLQRFHKHRNALISILARI